MPPPLHRREFCKLLGSTTLMARHCSLASSTVAFRLAEGEVVAVDGSVIPPTTVQVKVTWNGCECRTVITNLSREAVRLKEVILFRYLHGLPAETWVYGEGFQMLTQTDCTLGSMHELGYPEQTHYRIPGPSDAAVVTSLLTLSPPNGPCELLAFTSCHRWSGRFYVRRNEIAVVLQMDEIELDPGESWSLERFIILKGNVRDALLNELARRLLMNHPRRPLPPVPTGWCSWYSFADQTTPQNVAENVAVITRRLKGLKYVQVDDGYQAATGDWLEPGQRFGGDVQGVLEGIRESGLEPAIWVAPFVAAKNSVLLREHPEWFVKNAAGEPLQASEVTFGGWGSGGSWYCLDGTHPLFQQHLESVFRVMHEQWGCTYFKLDANFWGAVHGGRFHDPKATRIEAYRRGMQAIRRATGGAFILGCNHPIWPSLGLIDGSRSSEDIARTWRTVSTCMRESMNRNWQNGRLWWNDPDAVLLASRLDGPMVGTLTEEEFRFHATSAYASGGMILSGDDLTTLTTAQMQMLSILLPPTGKAAVFDDPATLEVGRIPANAGTLRVAVFNRRDEEREIEVRVTRRCRVTEVWTGADLGMHQERLSIRIPGHGARVLALTPLAQGKR